jgi:transposase
MERPPAGPRGPRSKLTPEVQEQLRGWIAAQSDLTLMELQQRLYRDLRLPVSIGRLWGVLQQMGLRLKKVAPRHRAGHRSRPP